MNYIEKYIKRLNDKGNTTKDKIINTSKRTINKQFRSSPSYKTIKINDNEIDCIINHTEDDEKKSIIFRPDSVIDIGSIIEYKNKNYLLISFTDDEISPNGIIQLCTQLFPIKEKGQKILIGRDELNRPVYESNDDKVINIPCIVKMNEATIAIADVNKPINLLNNVLYITIPYTESESIDYDQEFEMYNAIYRIIRIDTSKSINKIGLMKLTAEMKGFHKGGGDNE